MDCRPIGIYDSGVGGLTVVKEVRKILPDEDIVYFGDTARLPYGSKSQQAIIKFSIENALFLLSHNVKAIIVACNSSSSAALEILRRNFKVPIIGVIEPGVKEAVSLTRNLNIGVIGTNATIQSSVYDKEIKRLLPKANVYSKSCPLFVPLVEEDWLDNDITIEIIRHYLEPIKKSGIDTMILGCTHYPLLRSSIIKVLGNEIIIVDSAYSAAKAVSELLSDCNLNTNVSGGEMRFFVSDEPDKFAKIGRRFLNEDLSYVRKAE